ncbi:SDR family NAD(P)-dependent oxidoreductase [Streptomyces sp. NPDC006465]|uniref:SDR family NAD(P)-dependent oxidoreductase n=1 Tax=Streptomyces sp. NPDC006465 TaxID=3157174 RepID=UPI0033A2116D
MASRWRALIPVPVAVAVAGVGANLGRAIARRFGIADHPVALISSNRDKLGAVAASLAEDGINTGFYPADATDAKALTTALDAAAGDLGRIGVLSYSSARCGTTPAAVCPTLPRISRVSRSLLAG